MLIFSQYTLSLCFQIYPFPSSQSSGKPTQSEEGFAAVMISKSASDF